ncbi:putative transcription factor interactor and regulator CCHC(Zn) family [Helianthus anomalus]
MGITRGLSKLDIGSGSMVHGKKFTKPGMVNKKRMAAKRIVKKVQNFKRGYFRSLKIRCYSCNVVGHKAINCPSKYLEVSSPVLHVPKDYLVKGTDLGTWDGYWFVDLSYKKHMMGNENMFKNLNRSPGVEIGFVNNNKLYSIGIGEVEIMINGQTRVIPGVNFVPALKRKNILSLNELNDQGYNVTFDGDVCYINDMFVIMNGPNNTGELVGENEQENDYWSDYIEKLDDQSANELKLGKLEADLEG